MLAFKPERQVGSYWTSVPVQRPAPLCTNLPSRKTAATGSLSLLASSTWIIISSKEPRFMGSIIGIRFAGESLFTLPSILYHADSWWKELQQTSQRSIGSSTVSFVLGACFAAVLASIRYGKIIVRTLLISIEGAYLNLYLVHTVNELIK